MKNQTPAHRFVEGKATPVHFEGNAMTLDYRVSIGHTLDSSQMSHIETIISETFALVDSVFNRWNPKSELSQLNLLPAGVKIPLSDELYKLLCTISEIVLLTDGLFDPTVLPLYELWNEHLLRGHVPSDDAIARISTFIGFDKINFGDKLFSKAHNQVAMDFGGIAKGHCVDLLIERLMAAGYVNILVDWSGEIRASGQHPEGRPWAVCIQSLHEEIPFKGAVEIPLYDESIATSGDYEQNWKISKPEGDVTYFHIMHPKLLRPMIATTNSIASASIKMKNCALADALASVMLMFPSARDAKDWTESITHQIDDIALWLISRSVAVDVSHP